MLPSKYRFKAQLVQGQKADEQKRNRYFLLKIFSTTNSGPAFTVVVGKKVSPLATKRNWLRRRVQDWIQNNFLDQAENKNYLFIVQSSAKDLLGQKDAIVNELNKLIS